MATRRRCCRSGPGVVPTFTWRGATSRSTDRNSVPATRSCSPTREVRCWRMDALLKCWLSIYHEQNSGGRAMNNTMSDAVALIGRLLLAAMFVYAGYGKIGGFEGTAGYIASKG